MFCDERRDRSQLYFPDTESLLESGVESGAVVVLRSVAVDVQVVVDREGGMTYSAALTHATRVTVRLDGHAPLQEHVGGLAQRLGLAGGGQAYALWALTDRGMRGLRMSLSLWEQRVGSVIVVQQVQVLLKQTLGELQPHCHKQGWMTKKSIKKDKATKNKRRWIVLTDWMLYYFKSNTSTSKPQGVVPLEYYSVNDKAMSGQFMLQHQQDAFCARSPDFVLSTDTQSPDELDEWKVAIRERCDCVPLFGVSLVELSRIWNNSVPTVLVACVDQLTQVAAKTEGLFRLSGAQEDVDRLCDDFRYNRRPNLAQLSPHVVAGCLKAFLRELPNPLLTMELHDDWIACCSDLRDTDATIEALQKCILRLPTLHQYVLDLLLGLMEAVDAAQDRTLMNAKNLAVAFTPSILVPISREPLPTKEQMQVVAALITLRSELFASLPEVYMDETPGVPRSKQVQVGNPGVNSRRLSIDAATGMQRGPPVKTLRGANVPFATTAAPRSQPVRPKATDVFSPAGSGPAATGTMGLVRFTYSARSDKELSVPANTEVTILKHYPNGWTLVECSHGKGVVPTSYVQDDSAPAGGAQPAPVATTVAPNVAMTMPPKTLPKKNSRSALPTPAAGGGGGSVAPSGGGGGGGGVSSGNFGVELDSLRKDFEAMRELLMAERERGERMEEDLREAREAAEAAEQRAEKLEGELTTTRKDLERMRLTMNRIGKEKAESGEGNMVKADVLNQLQEEIEVLDTKIDDEENARRGLESAVMALVHQLQQDLEAERMKVDRLQEIVDAWSQ